MLSLCNSGLDNIHDSFIAVTDETAEIANSVKHLNYLDMYNVNNRPIFINLLNNIEGHLVYIRVLNEASITLQELNEQLAEQTWSGLICDIGNTSIRYITINARVVTITIVLSSLAVLTSFKSAQGFNPLFIVRPQGPFFHKKKKKNSNFINLFTFFKRGYFKTKRIFS